MEIGQNLIGGYAPGGLQYAQVCASKPLNLCESEYLVSDPSTPCGKWIKIDNQANCGPCISCNELSGGACVCWKLDCLSNYDAKELWPIYKAKYNKRYGPCEDQRRFNIFKKVVEEAAKKGNKYTVTEMADAIFSRN